MAYVITNDCSACGTCMEDCPVSAISEGSVYSISPNICTECGCCVDVCPNEAIIFEQQNKSESINTDECPFCGSKKVKKEINITRTAVAYGAGFLASAATSAFYGLFGSSGGPAPRIASKAVREEVLSMGTDEYECKDCGRKWKV